MDTTRKPQWLRAKLPAGPAYSAVRGLVDQHKLHTVCQSAQCPNLGECWSRGTATLMILGNICTRSCNFCAIQTGRPTELDLGEPARELFPRIPSGEYGGSVFFTIACDPKEPNYLTVKLWGDDAGQDRVFFEIRHLHRP